jgi:hypothetical protein
MKNLMAPNIPLALVLLAMAAVALRAAARRPGPPEAPGTRSAPVTVVAGHRRPQPTVSTGKHDGAWGEVARLPAAPGRPASGADQVQHIFHELHADGRHALCGVCDSQYASA